MTQRRGAFAFAAGLMLGLAALAAAPVASAQGFAAAITPPRFEIALAPGATSRQVMEITHAGAAEGRYRVSTADWRLGDDGALAFFDTLQPGSCRPWVAIERKSLALAAGSRIRYRFEVAPPADAAPTECRFALMIESEAEGVQAQSASIPMSGRIAVIVYARIGDVAPAIEIRETAVRSVDGQRVPALRLFNAGNATARPGGFVSARDADGNFVDLSPEAAPILPGATRWIALMPSLPPDRLNERLSLRAEAASAPAARPALRFPLRVEGTLEIGPEPARKLPLAASFQ